MSEFTYAMLYILASITMMVLIGVFHYIFERHSFRFGMGVSILLTTITTVFDIMYVLRVHEGILNDYVMLIFTNLLEDLVNMRFSNLPQMVINGKVTPKSIEATVFAVFAGMSNLGYGVVAPIIGNLIASALGINKVNLGNFYLALIIKLILSVVPLTFLFLVPNKGEIENDLDLKRLNQVPERK